LLSKITEREALARELSGFGVLFHFSVGNAIRCYRAILGEYRSGELTNFSRKYTEKWRIAYLNVPKIQYQEKKIGPAGDQ